MLAPTTLSSSITVRVDNTLRYISDKSADGPSEAPALIYKTMPPSSPKFVGYEDYLHRLDEHFVLQPAHGQSRPTFVLYGVGGVGKTQISLRFAENLAKKYVMIT